MRIEGTVKHWNHEKGYGFIAPDAGGDDLFVHITGVIDGCPLERGERVSYELGQGRRGMQAIDVQIVEENTR